MMRFENQREPYSPCVSKTDELLLESAPLARRLAPRLCHKDSVTGESCAWIHGFWQYLRLFGLASTPDHHVEFFVHAMKGVTEKADTPRVLVSGAADYAMLALVIEAYRERNIPPHVTVVDRCETPLMLNRWHAERAALEITTRRCDIFEYGESDPFDVLCTHSFFSEFPPEQRPAILMKWRQLLRPGGAAIFVNRVRPGSGPGAISVTPEQARAFGAAVLQQAQAMGAALSCDPFELARDAETYMSRRISYPVQREEITGLLENAGFTIQDISCGPPTAAVRHDVTGPTTPAGAEYARIVARLP
jgi:SAM-dependent methyltransferase